jgi:hypothetical protein
MLEEAQKVGTGVRGTALTDDLAADDLECGIEACDAGAPVVMGLPCGQSRPYWQQGLRSFQSLDLGLLVEAEHDGVCRGVQIEADDIMDSLFGLGISDELEALEAMGLEVVGLPDAMDRHVGDAGASGHLSGGPLSEPFVGLFQSQSDDLSSLARLERRGASGARLVMDPGDSIFTDSATDPTDLDGGVPAASSDLCTRNPIHHQQDRSCPTAQSCRSGGCTDDSVEFTAVFGSERERLGLSAHGM